MEENRKEAERFQTEQKMGNEKPTIRFDYKLNIWSGRGDYKSHVDSIILYFPFAVPRTLCKKFEFLVNLAFRSSFISWFLKRKVKRRRQ